MIMVRAVNDADLDWKLAALTRAWGATVVARRGELIDALALDGFIALENDERVGLLVHALRDDGLEVVAIHAEREGRGIGRALMDAARAEAIRAGATRLWLSTTNDNVRALDFYQRWGMDLCALLRGGVAVSRRVKPSIPLVADNGLPIAHELEFELVFGQNPGHSRGF